MAPLRVATSMERPVTRAPSTREEASELLRAERDRLALDPTCPPRLEHGLGDREVLNREARGVEQRDLVVRASALRPPRQDVADLGDRVAAQASGRDRARQLP